MHFFKESSSSALGRHITVVSPVPKRNINNGKMIACFEEDYKILYHAHSQSLFHCKTLP